MFLRRSRRRRSATRHLARVVGCFQFRSQRIVCISFSVHVVYNEKPNKNVVFQHLQQKSTLQLRLDTLEFRVLLRLSLFTIGTTCVTMFLHWIACTCDCCQSVLFGSLRRSISKLACSIDFRCSQRRNNRQCVVSSQILSDGDKSLRQKRL